MAEDRDSAQERTEEPTGRRLQKAREKGQVPRSRELDTFLMLLTAAGAFLFFGPQAVASLADLLREGFSFARGEVFDPAAPYARLREALLAALGALAPILALLVVAAVLAPMALGGRVFSPQLLAPDLGRLDPVRGIKRVLGWRGLMELAKALVKFLVVGGMGVLLLHGLMPRFLALGEAEAAVGIGALGHLLHGVFAALTASLLVVVLADVPFQLWEHRRQLRMTRQEIKDELKETEGSPEVRSKLRSKQMEILNRRMLEEVPKADVVVTNPTHYAVALRYEQERMGAPKVVASGVDEVALHIRRIAEAHAVPRVEAPVLARALFHSTAVGEEIPEGLYVAVAQVLAYVYRLRQYRAHGGVPPEPPTDYPIPDELRRDE